MSCVKSILIEIKNSVLSKRKLYVLLLKTKIFEAFALDGCKRKIIIYGHVLEPLSALKNKLDVLTQGSVMMSEPNDLNFLKKKTVLKYNLSTAQPNAELQTSSVEFYFGSVLSAVSLDKKQVVFNCLKQKEELSSLCVTYSQKQCKVIIFMSFKKARTVFFVTRFLSECLGDLETLEVFQTDMNYLKLMTSEDSLPLFLNCNDQLFDFTYQLQKWIQVTPVFDLNDPFIKCHLKYFNYIKCYWNAVYLQ